MELRLEVISREVASLDLPQSPGNNSCRKELMIRESVSGVSSKRAEDLHHPT